MLARLRVSALRGERIAAREGLRATQGALRLRSLLRGQRPAVEDEVRRDAVVPEEPHPVHRVFDVSVKSEPRGKVKRR